MLPIGPRGGTVETIQADGRNRKRADAALYGAKLRGRDCVVVDAVDTESITRLAGGP